ncbi:flagellar basal body protein FliL [Actinokineospora sp. G85]|uniref:flagellar basal body protein FliL n=1 Tax=Actinokineospora sp. G85 TaxID=3406626 RepID=UPI003C782FE6
MTYPPGPGGQWQPNDPHQQQYPQQHPAQGQEFAQSGGFPQQQYQGQQQYPGHGPTGQWDQGGYPLPPAQPGGRKRKGLVIGVVAAVFAVAAGAGVTVWALNRGEAQAGSDSPTAAATGLVDALTKGDIAGLLTELAPAERDLMTTLNSETTKELQRLEVYRSDVDPNKISGMELTTENLVFDEAGAERVNDHLTITKLTSGKITLTSDAARLPFTQDFLDIAFPDGVPGGKETETIDIAEEVAKSNGGKPVRIATVQVDGEWYPSLLYTIADYALAEEKRDWPTTPLAKVGGSDPEGAVRGLVEAGLRGDLAGAIGHLPPDEMGVLYDVGPAIIEEVGDDAASGVTLLDLSTETQDVDNATKVLLKEVTLRDDDSGERLRVTKDGECYAVEVEGDKEQMCADDLATELGGTGMSPDAERAVTNLVKGMMANTGVVTTQVDGKWYVSPLRSLTDIEVTALKSLQPEDIKALIELADE